MSEAASARYVMGHDDRERRRLALQGSIFNPFTEQLMRRAGIASGMHVLDVGCGVGDVSLLAARLVGSTGGVTCIDIDDSALAIGRQRARDQGFSNVNFQEADAHAFRSERPFDAVIGRHIFIHTPDPLALMRSAFTLLNPGGVAAFQEYDFSVVHPSYPELPLRDRVFAVCAGFFSKATSGNIGTRLFSLFLEAGFPTPDCRAEYPMDGGPDSPFYEWMSESLRSILPPAEALGLVPSGEIDIDTLAERLKQEAVSRKGCSASAAMVSCFARKPS
jgi:ubiquinone/menaquinone biosynthesis C-methylase UbiE